ncbi:MAG: hypothetical protein JJ969_05620 [Rhizobiaceae bacterium]|nr:hypothetical protein [Rhizobiaceae bacterium]
MLGLLGLFWVAYVAYVLVGFIKPLRPFRTRWQVLFAGVPSILLATFLVGVIAAGIDPDIRGEMAPSPRAAPAQAEIKSAGAEATETEPQLEPVATQPRFDPVAVTHYHDVLKKQVTYRSSKLQRVARGAANDDVWSLADDHTDVICFEDGNNAVFFTDDGNIYAANGKARQFLNPETGDGMIGADDSLVPVLEPDRGTHHKIIGALIEAGLNLCRQKNLGEIADAVTEAVEGSPAAQADAKDAAFLKAAFAIKGAERCRVKLDAAAMVEYLQAAGIEISDYETRMGTYLIIMGGVVGERPKSEFCPMLLESSVGPAGLGFVSK